MGILHLLCIITWRSSLGVCVHKINELSSERDMQKPREKSGFYWEGDIVTEPSDMLSFSKPYSSLFSNGKCLGFALYLLYIVVCLYVL